MCANMADLLLANIREISNSQKVRPLLETEALNVEHLWKSSRFFETFLPRIFFCRTLKSNGSDIAFLTLRSFSGSIGPIFLA